MVSNEFLTTIQLSHLLATDIGINGDEATVIDAINSSITDVTLGNLKNIISDIFHIQIDQDRIKVTVDRLVKAKKLYYTSDVLSLSFETIQEISKVIILNEQTEYTAINEWLDQYQLKIQTELTQDILSSIKLSILNFIRTFFLTNGADCYKFITGSKINNTLDIKSIAEECAKKYSPEYSDSLSIFMEELFTCNLSSSQTSFLLTQLKKAINYLSMVVDTNAESALLNQLNEVTIYLDTTVLYRLFNLQGTSRFESIKKIIDYCLKTDVKLKVFQTSVEELKRRIKYDSQVIINNPIPVDFASIGYNCRTSDNYISTFWNEQRLNGVSAKDFNFRYSNVIPLLQEYLIEIDDRDYINEFCLEEKKLDLSNKVVRYSSYNDDYQKTQRSIEHDAECLTCIEHLQIKYTTSAIESKTFFLSTDWSLIKLQRNDIDYKNKTDMVVLPSQLIQLLCMTSPTTDYYEAFLGLFSSSHTSFGTNNLTNSQMQEIMGRVAMYKGTSPSFAEKILTSQLIQTSFSQKETEEEKNKLIDNVMISQVELMEVSLEEKDLAIENKSLEIVEKDSSLGLLTTKVISLEAENSNKSNQLIETKADNDRYYNFIKSDALKKSKIYATFRVFFGWLFIILGISSLLFCIAAIIPLTSHFTLPIITWIKSSISIQIDHGSLLSIILGIATFLTPIGFKCKKNGYAMIAKSFYDNFMLEIDSN